MIFSWIADALTAYYALLRYSGEKPDSYTRKALLRGAFLCGKELSGLGEYLRWRAELLKRQNELLDEFVKNVAERLGRCAVLLFGSGARDNHLPYSDFDIAIVVEEAVDKLSLIEELRASKPRGLPLDLVIFERGSEEPSCKEDAGRLHYRFTIAYSSISRIIEIIKLQYTYFKIYIKFLANTNC